MTEVSEHRDATALVRGLVSRAQEPVDIAWLAAFRVLFGLLMLVSMGRYLYFGWVDALFVAPTFHFKYFGFAWVEPLPGPLMHMLVWALSGLSVCITLGALFRVSSVLFAIGFSYLQLIDVANYLNHYYLAALLAFLLCVSPAHHAFSVDSLVWPALRRMHVVRGWHWLFRFQVGVVYVFAGLAKGTSDWLVYAQPLSIWLGSKTDMPLLGLLWQQPWAATVFSWCGFVFDTTIVGWLLWPRTRLWAYAVVLVFHAVTGALFPIGMFPAIMVVGALVMFSPSWPRVLWARLGGSAALVPAPVANATPAPLSLAHKLALGLVACHVVVQVAVPLRHLAYPGSVLWHEQGMRFSWRVMVREKNGHVSFVLRDPATDQRMELSPRDYLTPWQEQEMWSQPDLILQLAQHVHRSLEHDLGTRLELRVDSRVSLNGRAARPMIDPALDLAHVHDGLAVAHWITPSPSDAPPRLTPVAARDAAPADAQYAELAR